MNHKGHLRQAHANAEKEEKVKRSTFIEALFADIG